MKKKLAILIGSLVLFAALVAPVLHSALAKPAPAEHPEYRDALVELRNARRHLDAAAPDGEGHREKAIRAIDESIRQCELSLRVLH